MASGKKIKVLVVDDSVFMRTTLKKILTVDEIEVIGTARNGKEGIEKVIELKPDVVTMDIEMPVMTGLEALDILMEKNPVPVIMVSTLTMEGADSTMEALAKGAVDFITKRPAFTEMYGLQEELTQKIIGVANNAYLKKRMQLKSRMSQARAHMNNSESDKIVKDIKNRLAEKAKQKRIENRNIGSGRKRPTKYDVEIIGLGISTGGPVALQELLKNISGQLPVCMLISQHMPPYFTKTLSERLDNISELTVKEAKSGDRLLPGHVYIAPGGKHLKVTRRYLIEVTEEPSDEIFKPSVNIMMSSIADVFGKKALGVIMTGMGNDGREGLQELHDKGGYIIAQDIDTCVVAGMPKAVINAGIADEIHPLSDLAGSICSIFDLPTD